MAGCIQKKSGEFYVVFRIKNSEGKWVPKWINTHTSSLKEAKLKGDEIVLNHKKNKTLADSYNLYFDNFILNWYEVHLKEAVDTLDGIKLSTYESYSYNVRHIVDYFKKNKILLVNLDSLMIEEFMNVIRRTGLSGNTRGKIHTLLIQSLDYAQMHKLIPYNPARVIKKPSKEKYHASILKDFELGKLIECCANEFAATPITLACYYGLRRSEVLGLRWSDIDFDKKTVKIKNVIVRIKSKVEKETKNESSTRTLPLLKEVETFLKKIKIKQAEDKLKVGPEWQENDYVCKTPTGSLIGIKTVNEGLTRTLVKLQLPHVRFHDLRHTTATFLRKLGYSWRDIQVWLGHSLRSTTTELYDHIDEEDKKLVGDGYNEFIKKSKRKYKKASNE